MTTAEFKKRLREEEFIWRIGGWGKTSPADFWDAGEEKEVTNRKWWPWTAANDLAGKEFMKHGRYLVRCTICKKEKYQTSGVYLCPEDECRNAVAILIELGYEAGWNEIADEWYTSWYNESLAEPTTEGG